MAVLVKYGFGEVADALRSRLSIRLGERVAPLQVEPTARGHSRAVRVRMALEELGPTFIKLGQLLSTRPDLITHEYIIELEKLQDQVAPQDFDSICTELEKQLGGKIDQIFSDFQQQPIAAGSIAQVHRATTAEGQAVVVKVRRPGIEKKIRAECHILEDLAGLLKVTLFESDTVDPQKMVRELTEAISREVDLSNERRNQLRFVNAFRDDPTVHIPVVYEKYCSEGVLTMEYIDGIRPGDLDRIKNAALDPKIIAARGANFVLKQIFEFGFFHTDPHPGNFFLLPENVLVPLDFGQVAFLSSNDRNLLNEIVLTIVDNEPTRMIQALDKAEMISEKTDIHELTADIEQVLGTYRNLPLRDIPLSKVITQLFDIIRRHNVRPPAQFTLMLKSVMTIENFATRLDPKFDIMRHLKPYARQLSLRSMDPKQLLRNMRKAMLGAQDLASRLPDDVNAIISKFRQGKFLVRIHHEHLENLTKTLDKSSNRISFALIIAALLVASSMLVTQQGWVLGLVNLQTLGIVGYLIAAVIGIWLIISIIRSRHL